MLQRDVHPRGLHRHPTAPSWPARCHGSMFDAKTGKVLQGPAPQPLPAITVTVDNGQIVTA